MCLCLKSWAHVCAYEDVSILKSQPLCIHMFWNWEWILKEKYYFIEITFFHNSQPEQQLGPVFGTSEDKAMKIFVLEL